MTLWTWIATVCFFEIHRQSWIHIAIVLTFWMSRGELMDLALQTASAAAPKKYEVKFSNTQIFSRISFNSEGLFWNIALVMEIATVYTAVPVRKCIMWKWEYETCNDVILSLDKISMNQGLFVCNYFYSLHTLIWCNWCMYIVFSILQYVLCSSRMSSCTKSCTLPPNCTEVLLREHGRGKKQTKPLFSSLLSLQMPAPVQALHVLRLKTEPSDQALYLDAPPGSVGIWTRTLLSPSPAPGRRFFIPSWHAKRCSNAAGRGAASRPPGLGDGGLGIPVPPRSPPGEARGSGGRLQNHQ